MARPSIPIRRSQRLAWLITGPLFIFAIAMMVPLAKGDLDLTRNIAYAPLFLVMFIVSGVNLLHFDVRRQGMDVTLTDIPVLLGLFYLPPLVFMFLGILSAVVAQAIKRISLVKAVFNVAAFTGGAACANLIVFGFGIHGNGPRTWVVLAAAVYVHMLTMLLAVVGVITLVQGSSQIHQLWNNGKVGAITATINIIVGLIIILALHASGWSFLLIMGITILLGAGYRAYAQFIRQHKSLAELYELTQCLIVAGKDGTLFDVLLGRLRELMQAESATVWLPEQGRHPEVFLSARVDYKGLFDSAMTPDSLRRCVVDTSGTVVVTGKSGLGDLRAQLSACGVKDAIAVPLRSGGAVVGTLEVAGRLGDRTFFSDGDVRLMETLGAHAAIAIENSRLVDRLRFDASHDPLTGLPNRRRMLEALSASICAHTAGDVTAVLLFDVVDLRQVNTSLGQVAGDAVLIEVARRLRKLSPAGAIIARIGGDEFVVEIRTASADRAISIAGSIRDGLRDSLTLGTLTVDIDTSVGVAIHPYHGDKAEILLRKAEVAARAAKRRTEVQLFDPGLESRSVRRLGLVADLRGALDRKCLDVYFQPKVTISEREVIGVECLARWEHPVHGPIIPEDIVAIAEHTGDLARLTEIVLREGLRRAHDWADQGRDLSVSVNIATRTLLDVNFPSFVQELLDEYGVDPSRLTLEIAEESIMDVSERALPVLRRLYDVGVRLSVDDFGMGYSSLPRLCRLPVHEVKIDRTFVQGMTTDPHDLAVVRAVVDITRHFGLIVVAEGVESELTLGVLEEINCDIGQGFLFSRPLPYERLDAWLRGKKCLDDGGVSPGAEKEVRWLRAVP